MDRHDIEQWLSQHPESVHTDPRVLLDRCEQEVRRATQLDAWSHARDYMAKKLDYYEHSFGLPASDAFVAREVCHEVARELKRHEPALEAGCEAALVSPAVFQALDSSARETLCGWILELARHDEHEVWQEIVHFTDRYARQMIREGMTNDLSWDLQHSYPRSAALVARSLIEQYEEHMAAEGIAGAGPH